MPSESAQPRRKPGGVIGSVLADAVDRSSVGTMGERLRFAYSERYEADCDMVLVAVPAGRGWQVQDAFLNAFTMMTAAQRPIEPGEVGPL